MGNNPDTLVAYLPSSTNEMTFTDKNGNVTPWKVVYDATDYGRAPSITALSAEISLMKKFTILPVPTAVPFW